MFETTFIDVPRLIRDLRSGEFEQGKNMLNDITADTYCCLGVACSRLVEDGVLYSEEVENAFLPGHVIRKYLLTETIYNTRALPSFVEFPEAMGLRGGTGLLPWNGRPRAISGGATSLAELNDSGEFSFNQIADILEYLYVNNVGSID